ncbi:hypothetical protein [Phycobacter azelaicus]|uniref:hypothetical protein n=1 Tax=Phycobacter azelaicus TaxID=2668075 RepID=UPI00186891A2|nr:hypothetical protein [Phycobacter azelaicus]
MKQEKPIVFERTAQSIARGKMFSASIALVVAVAFGSILALVDDLPIIVSTAALGSAAIGLVIFFKIVKEARDVLKDGRSWRVEITENKLIWASPVDHIMKPFELNLDDIRGTRRLFIIRKNSKVRPKNEYFIDLRDGSSMKISDQLSAIPPKTVFEALQERGIDFQEETLRQGDNLKISLGN